MQKDTMETTTLIEECHETRTARASGEPKYNRILRRAPLRLNEIVKKLHIFAVTYTNVSATKQLMIIINAQCSFHANKRSLAS
jgi:hypothetical protein